jgi:hypothetical protein
MSSADAAKKLKAKFSGALPAPPEPSAVIGNIQGLAPARRPGRPAKPEKMVQLNLRVPQLVKDRLRLLAARDRRDMSQIAVEAIELYEREFGAAPKLKPMRVRK